MVEDSTNGAKKLEVILTNSCNRHCSFCFTHSSPQGQQFLKFEDFVRALEQENYSRVFLYGGEPFFHPEFKRFYEHALKTVGNVEIVTNGSIVKIVNGQGKNLNLGSSVMGTKEKISEYDNPETTLALSINRELMVTSESLIRALILYYAIQNARLKFNVGYFKDEKHPLSEEVRSFFQSHAIDIGLFLDVRPLVALGRGETTSSRLNRHIPNLRANYFLGPSGKIHPTSQQLVQEMKGYVRP